MDLITGSTGFIGSRLRTALAREGRALRALSRRPIADEVHTVGDLLDFPSLVKACAGVQRVFHCAGYAHAWAAVSRHEAEKHFQVNFEGTRQLLEAAGRNGVSKFVFLSSVKAMAEPGSMCADEHWPGQPATPYGQAKRDAEQAVLEIGQRYGMHVVNLRLAMVYGHGGRGNLERMGRLVKKGWFPPLPETGNHRSLVHVDDVVGAVKRTVEDARANGQTYIVASPKAPSGRQLYQALRVACGLAPVNWEIPLPVMKCGARLGSFVEGWSRRRMPLNGEVLARLLESAWYSPEKIKKELGWQAEVSLGQGLQEMFGC